MVWSVRLADLQRRGGRKPCAVPGAVHGASECGPHRPDGRGARNQAMRGKRFRRCPDCALALGFASKRPPLLPRICGLRRFGPAVLHANRPYGAGPLCRSEPGRPIPYLDHVLLDFPELRVVGGHVGAPWIEEVLSLARKYSNFFIDTSAYAVHRLPQQLIDFMRSDGRGRDVWHQLADAVAISMPGAA
jgi:Amidohydrolase